MTLYEIRIEGSLDERWSNWFCGLAIAVAADNSGPPVTTLTGLVADQPALRGILNRIWDLNLNLISVNPLDDTKLAVI